MLRVDREEHGAARKAYDKRNPNHQKKSFEPRHWETTQTEYAQDYHEDNADQKAHADTVKADHPRIDPTRGTRPLNE